MNLEEVNLAVQVKASFLMMIRLDRKPYAESNGLQSCTINRHRLQLMLYIVEAQMCIVPRVQLKA